jgi:cytochrome c oxidase subunit IV
MEEDKKKQAFRVGEVVFLLLAVLTAGEYFIGSVASIWWAPLLGIAILKAFLIVRDYMHIGRVFAVEDDHE